MDEVWKDMSLASTPAALHYSLSPAAYGDLTMPQPPRTLPPPHTALTLRSSSLQSTCPGDDASSSTTGPASNSTSSGHDSGLLRMPDPFVFSTFPDSSTNASSSSSRSVAVQAPERAGSDRRHRRMMKNRESAVRSRERKQAYANDLELELEQLKRENTMLIKREQDFHARMALAAQVPDDRSSTLQRCRSAPPP